jgi:hypothetical protein
MQVDWETIREAWSNKGCGSLAFVSDRPSVMRLLRKESEPPPEWQRALDRIFGTHDWHSRFYVTRSEPDWFEKEIISTHRIADWQAVGHS